MKIIAVQCKPCTFKISVFHKVRQNSFVLSFWIFTFKKLSIYLFIYLLAMTKVNFLIHKGHLILKFIWKHKNNHILGKISKIMLYVVEKNSTQSFQELLLMWPFKMAKRYAESRRYFHPQVHYTKSETPVPHFQVKLHRVAGNESYDCLWCSLSLKNVQISVTDWFIGEHIFFGFFLF